ncbi:MAG: family 16 glycoside hydrolase, partial [Verrucomicrobiota bacterium]
EVTVKGSTIRVELNGTVILDTDLATVDLAQAMSGKAHPGKDRKTGYFGLAGHTDPVAFKDLAIRKL